jgi:phosphoribosylanthranilate isomerase
MKPRVKICGITNLPDALACARAGADALGFIFYEKSPRAIDPSAAAGIISELPPYVTPVGVFVNTPRERIASIISQTGIRSLQLSGDETPEECRDFPVSVVKVFRMKDPAEVDRAKAYQISAAMLDGGGDGLYGGTGTMPDLSVAERLMEIHKLIFAGGLSPDNIGGVLKRLRPYGVDVNSGVESSPGTKDHNKVRLLFERLSHIE